MNLEEIFTEEEKELIRLFHQGKAATKDYDHHCDQWQYMFKIRDDYYYHNEENIIDEKQFLGPELDDYWKRYMLSMILRGKIYKIDNGNFEGEK